MGKVIPVDEGAEAFVEMLNANEVEYIFLNPGTDTFPIQEALSKFKALGKRTPEVILCLHETVAMCAAHGHFMISGKPQVVLVHVDVGTQNVGGALNNAQRSRIGVIFCAGRAPHTSGQNVRGERSGHIHWLQDQYDQGGIVRGYVKWDYELRTNANIHQVVQRAFQMALSEPSGPVYLTLPRELLMEKIESVTIPDLSKHAPSISPQADESQLEVVAEMLLNAENPLVITGDPGKNPEFVPQLVELAESLGVRVTSSITRLNFPSNHELASGSAPKHVSEADVILVIESYVPYLPHSVNPRSDARIVHISIDPIKNDIPIWEFPGDIFIHADPLKAVRSLNGILKGRIKPEQKERFEKRAEEIGKENNDAREALRARALSKAGQKPIAGEWLGYCINEAINEDTIVLHELSHAVMPQIQRTKPGTVFGDGGSSLGLGLGGAIGSKLAAPDKTVVSVVGDGSFIFGCPIAAFWAAKMYKTPFLTVITNNQEYHAARASLRGAYGEDSYSEKTGVWIGIDIPSPDYAQIAEACGAHGQTIEDPDLLPAAIKEGLDQVRQGRAAVIDVRLEKPYP